MASADARSTRGMVRLRNQLGLAQDHQHQGAHDQAREQHGADVKAQLERIGLHGAPTMAVATGRNTVLNIPELSQKVQPSWYSTRARSRSWPPQNSRMMKKLRAKDPSWPSFAYRNSMVSSPVRARR